MVTELSEKSGRPPQAHRGPIAINNKDRIAATLTHDNRMFLVNLSIRRGTNMSHLLDTEIIPAYRRTIDLSPEEMTAWLKRQRRIQIRRRLHELLNPKSEEIKQLLRIYAAIGETLEYEAAGFIQRHMRNGKLEKHLPDPGALAERMEEEFTSGQLPSKLATVLREEIETDDGRAMLILKVGDWLIQRKELQDELKRLSLNGSVVQSEVAEDVRATD